MSAPLAISHQVYGRRLAVVPYVMPGFVLSLAGADAHDAEPDCEGLFLVNHGLFSFGADAKESYERMIEFVTLAEDHLGAHGVHLAAPEPSDDGGDGTSAARLAAALKDGLKAFPGPFAQGAALNFRSSPAIRAYLARPDLEEVAARGTITPDHVIRIKPRPLIVGRSAAPEDIRRAIEDFADRYRAYFERNAALSAEPKHMLDPLPRVVLVPGLGLFGLGTDAAAARIVADLAEQSARVIHAAEAYGRFTPLSEAELFDMEYWSLEQAKLVQTGA